MLGDFSGFVVPIAEELPTQADSDAGFVAASDGIVTNVIPLKTNQFIVTIDTAEARSRNPVGVGGVRIPLYDVFVRWIDRNTDNADAEPVSRVTKKPRSATLVGAPPIKTWVPFPGTSVTIAVVIVRLKPLQPLR